MNEKLALIAVMSICGLMAYGKVTHFMQMRYGL